MNKKALVGILSGLVLAGCAELDSVQEEYPAEAQAAAGAQVEEQAAESAVVDPAPESAVVVDEQGAEAILYKGTDRSVRMPAASGAVKLAGDSVSLNFEQAPLVEVVHAILGEILGLDYIVEHPISGEVTLRTSSPIPRDQLLPILESLLQSNGAAMVRDAEQRYFVSASPNLTSLVPKYSNPSSRGAGFSNVIVPLQYISAAEMADILRPVAPEGAFVRIDAQRNLLVLAGTRNQVDGWMEIVHTFDVDQLAGMSVGIFPIENRTVEEVYRALEHLTGSPGGEGGPAVTQMVRILPLEALGSILVVTPRAHYLDTVQEWVERLDQVQEGEESLHVYAVQNGNATHLAELLSSILGYGGGGSGAPRDSGVAPGLTQQQSGSGSGLGSGMPSTGSSKASGSGQYDFGDGVRVVADNYNNALLVYASGSEYLKIKSALERLDVVPAQVLIEASILEVQLVDDLEYGLEWAFNSSLSGGDYTGNGLLNLNDRGGIAPQQPGFSYSITTSAGDVRAVVNALAEKSLVNVISTPSVLVLDNHTAAIHVGDQQPIRSSTTITDGGNESTSIVYKDTGVKLEVTPSVNAGGLVTMDIMQSVTDVGSVDVATQQRAFLERNISSRVAIRTGESVVLGGLIRDNDSEGKSGVPLLMDIPVVGNLFSTTTKESSRTELLVFITPRVLNDKQELRDISREMRMRMKGLKNFSDLPLQLEE